MNRGSQRSVSGGALRWARAAFVVLAAWGCSDKGTPYIPPAAPRTTAEVRASLVALLRQAKVDTVELGVPDPTASVSVTGSPTLTQKRPAVANRTAAVQVKLTGTHARQVNGYSLAAPSGALLLAPGSRALGQNPACPVLDAQGRTLRFESVTIEDLDLKGNLIRTGTGTLTVDRQKMRVAVNWKTGGFDTRDVDLVTDTAFESTNYATWLSTVIRGSVIPVVAADVEAAPNAYVVAHALTAAELATHYQPHQITGKVEQRMDLAHVHMEKAHQRITSKYKAAFAADNRPADGYYSVTLLVQTDRLRLTWEWAGTSWTCGEPLEGGPGDGGAEGGGDGQRDALVSDGRPDGARDAKPTQ